MRYERASEAVAGQLAEGVLVVAGPFIAVSGWIFGYGGSLPVGNLVIGLAIAALGFAFGAAYGRTHGLAWVCPVLGAWTIVARWAVSGAAGGLGALLGDIVRRAARRALPERPRPCGSRASSAGR